MCRAVRNDYVSRALSKGILDGDLLGEFSLLNATRQASMTKRVGSDVATIGVNLRSLKAPW
jgi:cleavage and polyadenylation specificity factor subunit 1